MANTSPFYDTWSPMLFPLYLVQTGLDVDVRRVVWEAIIKARRGRCILMSTHRSGPIDDCGGGVWVVLWKKREGGGRNLISISW